MFWVVIGMAAATAGCYAPRGGVPTVDDVVDNPPEVQPYRIQIGDQIAVRFYRNPELNHEVIVRPDGRISLPFVDDVDAVGLTPQELDVSLTRRYKGELAVPDVTVIVQGFGGQRIYVGGEVSSEGVFDLRGGMTLYQAINQAGGFTDIAHRRQVILIRKGPDGRPKGHSIDLVAVEHGTRPENDVPLQPYDVVFVPKSKIGQMDQWVDQYIRRLLPISPGFALSAF